MDDVTTALDELQGTSVDKAHQLLTRLNDYETDDAELAPKVALFKMIAPQLWPLLPQEPAELDHLLLAGAALFLKARSDDAPPVGLTIVDADAPTPR